MVGAGQETTSEKVGGLRRQIPLDVLLPSEVMSTWLLMPNNEDKMNDLVVVQKPAEWDRLRALSLDSSSLIKCRSIAPGERDYRHTSRLAGFLQRRSETLLGPDGTLRPNHGHSIRWNLEVLIARQRIPSIVYEVPLQLEPHWNPGTAPRFQVPS